MLRIKKTLLISIILLFSLLLIGAKPIKINYPLKRVISLAPNLTEMICLLNKGDILVGITDACDYPKDVLKIEKTGPFGNPDLEKILMLKPDIIFYSEVKDLNFSKKIDDLGIPAIQIDIASFNDLEQAILVLGKHLEEKEKAQEIFEAWQAKIKHAKINAKWKSKVRVYFELWKKPLITVGRKSYLHEMIEMAGGVNIAEKMETAYPKPPQEFVIGADPEIIFLGYEVSGNIEYPESWQKVTAIQKNFIVSNINLDWLLRPGPRLFQGLDAMKTSIENVREILEKDKVKQ
ncbi:MAG: ABC transporter substrate-binding protein [Candidatus Margulisbacteria bacterium]|nr:ABC transporter substrate-binding protein [Candidatus Margulisiibacteriota bacterium]